MSSKYAPLRHHLAQGTREIVTLSFPIIEQLIGSALPPSAYTHRAWWANEGMTGHVQARSWASAGYEVVRVDLGESVTFMRVTDNRDMIEQDGDTLSLDQPVVPGGRPLGELLTRELVVDRTTTAMLREDKLAVGLAFGRLDRMTERVLRLYLGLDGAQPRSLPLVAEKLGISGEEAAKNAGRGLRQIRIESGVI